MIPSVFTAISKICNPYEMFVFGEPTSYKWGQGYVRLLCKAIHCNQCTALHHHHQRHHHHHHHHANLQVSGSQIDHCNGKSCSEKGWAKKARGQKFKILFQLLQQGLFL